MGRLGFLLLARVETVPERYVALRDPVEDPVGLRLRDDLLVDEGLEAWLEVGDEAGLELLLGDALVPGEVADLLTGPQVLDQRFGRDAQQIGLGLDHRSADGVAVG